MEAKFPRDFKKRKHPHIQGAVYWSLKKDGQTFSIVGGARGLYGDAVSTFEFYHFEGMDSPMGWASKDKINEYLKELK